MYVHNLDPNFINLGFVEIKWYSLAYILGILFGWFWGKKIISHQIKNLVGTISSEQFDDLITYIIISIILGGRLGYVFFYNADFYLQNPLEIIKIWEGGMSFHGGFLGVVFGSYIYTRINKIQLVPVLDIVACVAPFGLFLGRIANFINAELYGKPTDIFFGVIFPQIDNLARHPSQIYEAFLEGLILLLILNFIMLKKTYKKGFISSVFLILYGIFRIFSEQFREPDEHLGYIFNIFSMGTLLSSIMLLSGIILYLKLKNEYKSKNF